MKLNLLLKGIDTFTVKGNRHAEIESISYNSKQIKNQGMFFAIKGIIQNGYNFIDEAIERGAVCVAAEEDFITYKNITKVIVSDIRKACAIIAANFYRHPSDRMNVIGITGTNGKTTTLYMVSAILQHAGMKCGMIGTVNYKIGPRLIPATNTTPSSIMLQMFLSDMDASGINNCVMEVSSHALHQDRVEAISFNRAIFTNLTSEHLDYHKNMDQYFEAKRKLFSMLKGDGMGIVNVDDEYGRIIAAEHKGKILTYGIKNAADIMVCEIAKSADRTSFKVYAGGNSFHIDSPLIGEYNIYNMLAATAWAISIGLSPALIKGAMESFQSPPGRMERIDTAQSGISVFVDYAHTDDALSNALNALEEVKRKRIITVFGCGGDRDKKKRPRMGRVAAGLSNLVIITSDNPRNENPEDIIDDIEKGLPEGFCDFKIIIDRRKAIEYSLSIAQRGDIVLIAGKGHENYQILKDTTVAFDDRKIAYEALQSIRATEKV
ncbi:MAG: UDP-N-acetylmuramoyl-L-alanyl-D-glutamate--2,6-diaminopimelate ligase [Dehalococcoidia bacterium]|nr:MAG: UDP-N-acetylmuramoyl-L-alanyl-D-glutamate--2,6-diaminopimelate ligase [Dehalococcoidia bacterium]